MTHNPFRKVLASAGQGTNATPSNAPIKSNKQFGLDPAVDGRRVAPIAKAASKADEAFHDEQGEYNPRPFGGHNGQGQVKMASQGRIFDRQCQLNAHDTKDAMQQVAYLLGHVQPGQQARRFAKNASAQQVAERRKIIAAAAQDPTGEGFALLGQQLLLPIKDLIDYEGWIRKVYRVRPLAQGELFRIARDVRATAWVIGQDGQAIESRMFGKYIQPSEFKIAAFPTVDIQDLYQMNYDVLDRAQQTARQEIELEEDKRGLALLDTAARAANTVTTFGTLGVAALEALRLQVEQNRLVVTKFLANRRDITDVFTSMQGAVDPVTQRELLLAGYWGNFFGAQIFTVAGVGAEEVIPYGNVYAVTDPEYLGEMGIRVELFSEPFNKYANKELVRGWAFCEIVGFAVANSRSAAVAQRM
jgi:hypothetical protein